MTLPTHLTNMREIMAGFPALDSHSPGNDINSDDIFYPQSHAAALDPDRSLVIGNRGMGKSFWASALVNDATRCEISKAFPKEWRGRGQVNVAFGFADAEGAGGVSRDELIKHHNDGFTAEMIWRAVILGRVAAVTGQAVPQDLSKRLTWVRDEPAAVRDLLRAADQALISQPGRLVFVFDQLEQLSDDFDVRRNLTQGILRLALAFKSYRGLRVKIFMRPDHFADRGLFEFPDASKISGEAVTLDWRPLDLYGLLFARLRQKDCESFEAVFTGAGISTEPVSRSGLPQALLADEAAQRAVFNRLAGEYMGSQRRGRPYAWLVLHLADARNQVSPRTFLRALRFAADHEPLPDTTAINHHGLHDGVRKASANRVDDLKEDYPWVQGAFEALKGLLVPCTPAEVIERWRRSEIISKLERETPRAKTPAWLAEPRTREDDTKALEELLSAMAEIGVIERRQTTGKIDVPDIFRLPFDIRRKGGVTPQQRRQVRSVQ